MNPIRKTVRRLGAWASSGLAAAAAILSVQAQSSPLISEPITIPSDGQATPFPSEIVVTNIVGTIQKVTVTLNNISHAYPDDLDILLVGPDGSSVMLMSDAGGEYDLSNTTLTFDSVAGGLSSLPNDTQISSGSFRPSNYTGNDGATDTLGGSAPSAPHGTTLDVFQNLSANGTWRLFVRDDQLVDGGTISSWRLNLFTRPIVQLSTNNVALNPNGLITMNEDGSTTVSIAITDAQLNESFTVTATSGTTSIIPNSGLVVSGSGNTRTLTITPAANANGGPVTVNIGVNDGASTVTTPIQVQVNPRNDAPLLQLNTATTQFTQGGISTNILARVTDIDTPAETLTLTAESSNPEIVAPGNVFFYPGDQNTNRVIRIVANGAATGTAVLNINLIDTSATAPTPLTNTQTITVTVTPAAFPVFANATSITVPDATTASIYPSSITVANVPGLIGDLQVTLTDVNHPNPDDLAVLLVSPSGEDVVLMRGAGDSAAITDGRLTFSRFGPALPDSSAITTISTNQPTDYSPGTSFTTPAPVAPYGTLDSIRYTNPNGEWKLFVMDTTAGSAGSIAGGWTLSIQTAPTISEIPAQTTNEDQVKTVQFTVGDRDGVVTNIITQVVSGPVAASVSPRTNALGSPIAERTLTITPITDQNGSAQIRIIAEDNNGFFATNLVAVTITPVNDAPTISEIPRQITRAGQPVGPVSFTITDKANETPLDDLVITVASDNSKIIPVSNILVQGTGGTRTLTLFPGGTVAGDARVIVTVTDAGGLSASESFDFTVLDAATPLFENISRITINDATVSGPSAASPYPSTITVGGLVGTVTDVRVTLSAITHPEPDDIDVLLVGPTGIQVLLMSDNGGANSLTNVHLYFADSAVDPLPDDTRIFSGTYQPSNVGGSDTFPSPAPAVIAPVPGLGSFDGINPNGNWHLYVVDDVTGNRGGEILGGWQLSIRTGPTITTIPEQVTNEDEPKRVTIVIGDSQPGVNFNIVTAEATVPNGGGDVIDSIAVTGTGGTRTLTITPVTNASGTNQVTVTVTDPETGATDQESFRFVVVAVDDPPTIVFNGETTNNRFTGTNTPAATPVGPIAITIGDAETAANNLRFEVTSSNTDLIPVSNIQIGGSGANRTLTIQPAGVQTGTSVITVTVNDKADGTGQKVSREFVVTVDRALAYANTSPITINTQGPASPYPSTITVSDVNGLVANVRVTLVGFRHQFPDDVDILLVAPSGHRTILMSDAGGATPITSDRRLTFASNGTTLPDDGPLPNGVYTPADYDPIVNEFAAPAPQGSFSSGMIAFEGVNPNGQWRLYVQDDTFDLGGQISGGWILSIETGPTITQIDSPQRTQEDRALTIPFQVLDADTAGTALTNFTVTIVSNSVPDLIVATNITITGTGNDRVLTVLPSTNLFGTNRLEIEISDPQGNTDTTAFNIIVDPVNDAPVLTTATNRVVVAEDADPSNGVLISFTASDVDSTLNITNFVVTSSNTALVPNGTNIVRGGSATAPTVRVFPTRDAFGSTTLTVSYNDLNGSTTIQEIVLEVTPVNDLPTISTIPTQTVQVGSSTTNIVFTVGDVETPARNLTVTARSLNTALVPNSNIALGGSGETRTIQLTTIGTSPGTAPIELVVNDGTASTTNTFNLNATASPAQLFANTTPITIRDNNTANPYPSTIAVAGMDGPIHSVTVTLDGFTHTAPDDVDVLLVSPTGRKVILMSDAGGRNPVNGLRVRFAANGGQLPDDAPLTATTYQPADFERNETFASPAPAPTYATTLSEFNGIADADGTWSLYVVDDTANDSGSIQFGWSLTIETAPTVSVTSRSPVHPSNSSALQITEDQSGTITLNLSDMVTNPNDLTLSFSSSNPTLLPTGTNIVVNRAGNTATLTVYPAVNQTGTNNLTITVTRPSDRATSSVVVPMNVTPVNDAPTISRLINRSTQEDTSTSFEFLIADVDTALTNMTLIATSDNESVIASTNIKFFSATNRLVPLTITGNQIPVTLTPNANAIGDANITFSLTDHAAGGGTVTSNFLFTVTARNDPPTISSIPNHVLASGASSTNIAFTVNDPDTGSLTVTATSSNQSVVSNSAIELGGSGSSRTIRVTTQPGLETEASTVITVRVSDGTSTADSQFTVTVRPTRERVFANTRPIDIRDNTTASDYPSTVTVSGLAGSIANVRVVLNGFTHRFPDDVDMLLVSPTGQKLVLMSDAGGGTSVTNLVLNFDQNASSDIPDSSIATGSYRPANYDGSLDVFVAPAPTGPYTNTLAAFRGVSPNGEWQLFIVDDTASDAGSISGGWSLAITTQPQILNLADVTAEEDTTIRSTFTVAEESFASGVFNFGKTSSNTAIVRPENIVVTGADGTFTVSVTPQANAVGFTDITLFLTNADQQVVSDTFRATFTARNDAPTVTDVADINLAAGTSSQLIEFNYSDPETDKKDLILTVASSNTDLIPTSNIQVIGNTLRVFPVGNQSGRAQITITIRDPQGLEASTSFLVTVTPATNPLFASTSAITINDNAVANPYPSTINVSGVAGTVTKVTVTLAGLSHNFPDDVDVLLVGPAGQKVLLMSDAGAGGTAETSLTNAFITFDDAAANNLPDNSAIDPNGTYKPSNYEGNETVRSPAPGGPYSATLAAFNGSNPNGDWQLYVQDDASPDAGSIVGGWILSIRTSAPTISQIEDQVLVEDVARSISFVVDDGNTAANNLVVTVTPDATPVVNATVTTTGNVRTLTLTPRANLSGSDVITLTVSDGTTTASTTFNVTVTPVNDAPVIAGLPATATVPANQTLRLPITVSDEDSFANNISVTATVNNSAGTVAVTGTSPNFAVVFTPAGAFPETSVVTVTATDGTTTSTASTTVTITEPLGPTIGAIQDITIDEDSGATVPVSITTPAASATVTATAENTALVAFATVSGEGNSRTLNIGLVPNANGSSVINVTVTDQFGSATESFVLTVRSVADAPTIGNIADVQTQEDVSTSVTLSVADIDTAVSNLTFSATVSNPNLATITFTTAGSNVVANINVTPNTSGVAAVVIAVNDGVNTASAAFALTVTAVNDAPTLSEIPNVTTPEDVPAVVTVGVSDPDTDAGSVVVTATAANANLVSGVQVARNGTNAVLTISLVPNATGTSQVTVTATDGAGSSSRSFTLTVTEAQNDAPTLGAIENRTVLVGEPVTVTLNVADPDTATENLTITATTTNPDLIRNVTFNTVNGNVVATLNFVTNATGTANVTISVNDGEHTVTRTFSVTVNRAAQPASLAVGLTGNTFNMTVTGTPNATYTIQSTSNFTTWTDVGTVTIGANGTGTFTTPATGARSFFRVVAQ